MQKATRTVNPGDIRRKLGLNQSEFWGKIGVTQSGGSRYESGRNMPRPVRELLRLVHIEGIDLTRAKGEDFAIAEHLKRSNAKVYEKMRAAVRSGTANAGKKSAGRGK